MYRLTWVVIFLLWDRWGVLTITNTLICLWKKQTLFSTKAQIFRLKVILCVLSQHSGTLIFIDILIKAFFMLTCQNTQKKQYLFEFCYNFRISAKTFSH